MDALSKTGKEYDMKINFKKTKVMRFCRNEIKREGVYSINIMIEESVVNALRFQIIYTRKAVHALDNLNKIKYTNVSNKSTNRF